MISGQLVAVYFNLHKKCWSIQCQASKLVIGYARTIVLEDVNFRVSQAGRRRVLLEQKKNVHAKVYGALVSVDDTLTPSADAVDVTYNPYRYDRFVTRHNEQPIASAEMAWLDCDSKHKVLAK